MISIPTAKILMSTLATLAGLLVALTPTPMSSVKSQPDKEMDGGTVPL